MHDSKTIKTIQDYYNFVNQNFNDLDNDNRFFCSNVELFLSNSLLQEFGEISAKKIGKILLAVCE